jgi:hypothetical protein
VAQLPPEWVALYHRNEWHCITGMGGTITSGICTSTIEKVIEKNETPEFTAEIVSQEDLSFLEDEIILNKESIVCSLKKLKTILNRIDLEKI